MHYYFINIWGSQKVITTRVQMFVKTVTNFDQKKIDYQGIPLWINNSTVRGKASLQAKCRAFRPSRPDRSTEAPPCNQSTFKHEQTFPSCTRCAYLRSFNTFPTFTSQDQLGWVRFQGRLKYLMDLNIPYVLCFLQYWENIV